MLLLILFAVGLQNTASGLDGQWSKSERHAIERLAPVALPPPPSDLSNKFADDPRAVRLGEALFFDPRFSGKLHDGDNDGSRHALGKKGQTGRVSCAGCHQPEHSFNDFRSVGKQIPLAAGWGIRKTPSLLDVAQAPLWMWDGRHDTLFGQIFSVLESNVEMNSGRLYVAKQLFRFYRKEYEPLFGPMPPLDETRRFPDLGADAVGCRFRDNRPYLPCEGPQRGGPGDQAEYDRMERVDQIEVTRVVANMGKALGAYVRTLRCGPSRFDAWAHGQSKAMSPAEKRGLKLFIGKAGCVQCHDGPYFSDQKFHNIGLAPAPVGAAGLFIDRDDPGAARGFVQGRSSEVSSAGIFSDGARAQYPKQIAPELLGAFRTPMLRCVSSRPSYFHTGQVRTLEEAVAFFTKPQDDLKASAPARGLLGVSVLSPVALDSSEVRDIAAFLRALDGRNQPHVKRNPHEQLR